MEWYSNPKEGNKHDFKYFYYLPYYPKRFSVSAELNQFRQLIYRFKDGYDSIDTATKMAKNISQYINNDATSDWWICIIPASTISKTENRFKSFCSTFQSKTGINNGYSLLSNKCAREAKHLNQDRDSINILDSIDFQDFNDKNVLLFDDIYTTGKSFTKVANMLIELGANEVIGLFLGKTHWLDENEQSIVESTQELYSESDNSDYMENFDLELPEDDTFYANEDY